MLKEFSRLTFVLMRDRSSWISSGSHLSLFQAAFTRFSVALDASTVFNHDLFKLGKNVVATIDNLSQLGFLLASQVAIRERNFDILKDDREAPNSVVLSS
jgi:hypothetical protein